MIRSKVGECRREEEEDEVAEVEMTRKGRAVVSSNARRILFGKNDLTRGKENRVGDVPACFSFRREKKRLAATWKRCVIQKGWQNKCIWNSLKV